MAGMGFPLNLREFGPIEGTPLLALHGVTGHGGRWRALAEEHLHGYPVLAPDLRGHGLSTPLPPWTLEQHAADVLGVLDAVGLPAVPVVAHSFGAAVALYLQKLAPNRISKLVLLDPAIGLRPDLALDRSSAPEELFGSPEEARAALWQRWPNATETAIAEELAENLCQVDGGWRYRFRYAAVTTAWSEMTRDAVLPAPGTPTLLVRALRAEYFSPAFAQACRLALGDKFELVTMDVEHTFYVSHPAETAELVARFVGQG